MADPSALAAAETAKEPLMSGVAIGLAFQPRGRLAPSVGAIFAAPMQADAMNFAGGTAAPTRKATPVRPPWASQPVE